MKYTLALTALALAVGMTNSANAAVVEGKDYKVLQNPEAISGDVIIVREFFWYGCIHCYNLEPYIEKWAKTKPKDVAFFQSPAAINPVWETSARGFYAAQLMGYQSQTHHKLFNTIFNGDKLNQNLAGKNKDTIIDWYSSQGLDKAKFSGMMDSFAVNTKVTRSKEAARRYQLTGTPSVVVQGKYLISAEPAKIPEVIDFLVDKVRAEKKK